VNDTVFFAGPPNASAAEVFLGSTGFSLCGFDLWQAKVKRTQAEACAT
jgi:hypothetical protein